MELLTILSRVSLAFEEAVLIFLLMSERAGLALSEISSSARIALVIFSSRNLLGTRELKYLSRLDFLSSPLFLHCFRERITLRTSAILSNSRGVSPAPAWALRRLWLTFLSEPKLGVPNLPIRQKASSVSLISLSASSLVNTGVRERDFSFASGNVHSLLKSSSILSNSSALKCLFIVFSIHLYCSLLLILS